MNTVSCERNIICVFDLWKLGVFTGHFLMLFTGKIGEWLIKYSVLQILIYSAGLISYLTLYILVSNR